MSVRLTDEQLVLMRAWHNRRGGYDPVNDRVVVALDELLALRERVSILEAELRCAYAMPAAIDASGSPS